MVLNYISKAFAVPFDKKMRKRELTRMFYEFLLTNLLLAKINNRVFYFDEKT